MNIEASVMGLFSQNAYRKHQNHTHIRQSAISQKMNTYDIVITSFYCDIFTGLGCGTYEL